MELTVSMKNAIEMRKALTEKQRAIHFLNKQSEALTAIEMLQQLRSMKTDDNLTLSFRNGIFCVGGKFSSNPINIDLASDESAELAKFLVGLLIESYQLGALLDPIEEEPAEAGIILPP